MTANRTNLQSSYVEKLIEHVFLADLLACLWKRSQEVVEILKPEVDDSGYDIVLEHNGVVRHIQLKSSRVGASTREQKVQLKLASKPSACVVWMWYDNSEMQIRDIDFFGGQPGEPLPSLESFPVAKHTKADKDGFKKDRPGLRVVKHKYFVRVSTMSGLADRLFGS